MRVLALRLFALIFLVAAGCRPTASTATRIGQADTETGDADDWRAEWPDIYPLCDETTTPRCDHQYGEHRLVTCEGGREMSMPFYSEWVGGLGCSDIAPGWTPQKVVCDGDSGWISIGGGQSSNVAACGSTHDGVKSVCTPVDDGLGVIRCLCNGATCPPDPEYWLSVWPSSVTLQPGREQDLEVQAVEKLWVEDVTSSATYTTSDATVAVVGSGKITALSLGIATITVSYSVDGHDLSSTVDVTVSP